MDLPFLDVHSHHQTTNPNVLRIQNCMVGVDDLRTGMLCSVGIHPWHIAPAPSLQYDVMESMISNNRVIGIGECGLDKHCKTNWNLQLEVFRYQIQLANENHKPLIIHSVRAYQEIIHELKAQKAQTPIVFHGFDKNITLAEQLLDKGYYLSLGAAIIHGNKDRLIQHIPLDRLFLETDDKTTNIVDIFSYFCAARKIGMNRLKAQLIENLEHVFGYTI